MQGLPKAAPAQASVSPVVSKSFPSAFHPLQSLNDQLLGVATLVHDDELPDAPEPGPWLAAVFVTPDARKFGVGSALVAHVVNRARELGYLKIYLYTEHQEKWYASTGWLKIRDIIFLGLHHTVMQLDLSGQTPSALQQ